MKLYTILFITILTFLSSCNGQNNTQNENEVAIQRDSAPAMGEVVSELDSSIWIVFQSSNNDYWFGSDGKGVYRYDGEEILHYSTDDGLPGNRIRGIQEDKSGNVFITTMEGISKFDGKTFTTLPVIENGEWKLTPDDLWFSILGRTGEDGPYRYDGKSLFHLQFPKHFMEDEYFKNFPDKAWSPYEVYSIYKDHAGKVWFGTSNFGLCQFDGKSIRWLYEEHLTLIDGGGSFGIRSIIEDKEGKFWFCNTRYRYNILPAQSEVEGKALLNYKRENGIGQFKAPNGKDMIYFMSVVEDSTGNLWMATYNEGVWKYDGRAMTQYQVKVDGENVTVLSIYKDKQGSLWLGTHNSGAYKFNGQSFEKFMP
jgi:ligand-binding sensor domain-containing protein